MDNNILLFLILGLTFVTTLTQLVFLLISSSRKHHSPANHSKEDDFDARSWKILHDAQEKANKILTNAELKGIEYMSKQKIDILKLEQDYSKSIKELEANMVAKFSESLDRADKTYQGFLGILQENLRSQELKNQQMFNEKTVKLVDSAQTTLTAFIADLNGKVSKQIDAELKAVRSELEMYKSHRLEIINKYIIDILERTLEETLGKKMTLDEHSDLIFQALEKAKNEQKLKT